MQLIIGNKNYSSWSLRPWILMTYFNMDFDEKVIKLFSPKMKQEMQGYCPAEKVPALIDNNTDLSSQTIHVWDTLAICEYINENYLDGKGWPTAPHKRATARSIANEMHSGFFGVRNELPMNIRRPLEIVENSKLSTQAINDIKRICTIWYEALTQKNETDGPFLFGKFSIADAMYFPVVSRFNTYGIAIENEQQAVIKEYMNSMLNLPAYELWCRDALLEKEVIDEDER